MLSKTLFAIAGFAAAALAFDGQATYYTQDGVAGSCGDYHSDDDFVIAVSYDQNPDSQCGKTVQITNNNNGNTQTAIVADTCPGCSYSDIDLSVGLAAALDSNYEEDGVFPVTWEYTS
jgi:hypothetical protein